MAYCLMYKEGDAHVVRGVPCEFVRIATREIPIYKEKGYKSSLNDLYEQKPEENSPQDQDIELLLDLFEQAPDNLKKDELVEIGKHFGLELHKRSKDTTMIEKIKEAQAL